MVSRKLKGYWTLSDHVLLRKLGGGPFHINLIQAYAPTVNSSDEELEDFYKTLNRQKKQNPKPQEVIIVCGDFSAKLGDYKMDNVVGIHISRRKK